jgi:hypothetical protein
MHSVTRIVLASLAVLISSPSFAVTMPDAIPLATAAARVQQREEQVQRITPDNYDLNRFPLNDANERHWRLLLWATAVVEPQEAYIGDTIAQLVSLTSQPRLSPAQSRIVEMALQVGTQLYLSNPTVYQRLRPQFVQTIERSQNSKWVAMSLSGLVKSGVKSPEWVSFVQQRFPRWSQDIYLYSTLKDIGAINAQTPPLRDLLQWTIAPNQVQLYAFCRPDRSVLCTTVLKDRQGQFVRENGRLWSMPLLTRSLHNLSWNFSRGYTPQGVYRIEGTIPQPDTEFFRAYGFFPLVQLFVPHEPGVKEFVPGQKGALKGTLRNYQALLPPSWHNYFPIQQSYWAGKAGRTLFRIHGSGEAPTYFTNNQRYPMSSGWNPAIGCLSTLELYDNTGRLQQTDMPKLLNTLTSVGGDPLKGVKGYLVVVELPGRTSVPVSLTEIEGAISR